MKITLNFITSALVLFLIITIHNISVAQNHARHEREVQKTISKLFDAISINDAAVIKSYCTNDVKFYEYGQVWPLDTLLQKLSSLPGSPAYNRTNTFDFVSTTVKGNIAWATYYLESTITKTGISDIKHWMETVILIKEKKQWKISVLHSTRLSKN
jgi:ketosteroid isomerase-like protein